MGIMEELKKIFTGDKKAEAGDKKAEAGNKNFLKNLVVLGMLGIFILLISDLFVIKEAGNQSLEPNHTEKIEMDYENKVNSQLEEIVGSIKGVGKVKVSVYIREYTGYEYEYNTSRINKTTDETDKNGGKREIIEDNIRDELVIIKDVSGNEKPVLRKETGPEIEGILIVAQGAENSHVRYQIIKAISSLLDIPVHRISVLPYERG